MPTVTARLLGRWLAIAITIASVLGLAIELVHTRTHHAVVEALLAKLSLSYEGNVPTWLAASLLLGGALAAAAIAPHERTWRRHWWGVAAVFAYASLDETAELHEHLGGVVDPAGELGGVLHFDWVIPAAAILAALTLVFLPFVRALPATTRNRLVVAGAIFVAGAVGMELPLGWVTERAGTDSLAYALVDWVEETLELVGAALALHTFVRHRELAEVAAEVRA